MKIAYCIPSCHQSGGMERVLSLKANYLADVLGWEVTVITTEREKSEPAFPLSPKVKKQNLDVNYCDEEKHPLLSRIFMRLKKKKLHRQRLSDFLFQERCDICVSMFCHEMSFLSSIQDGSKKVLELHFCKNFRRLDIQYNKKGLLRYVFGLLQDWRERSLIRRYNAFVVLTREDARDWGMDYRCNVIPNPLPFQGDSCTHPRTYRAIAVGRLCPQKGFDLLIRAWELLPYELKQQWSLAIYGDGPEKDYLTKLISSKTAEGHIRIHAPVKDIQKEMESSSIFCFPSRYEGFGMALLEAMGCGLSCLSFDCPCGPKDMIKQNVNGILVDSFSIERFSSALERLMRDEQLRLYMGREAARNVRENFSLDKIMKQWRELFEDLIKP